LLRKQSVVIMPLATDELEKELEDAINRRNNVLLTYNYDRDDIIKKVMNTEGMWTKYI